jgi:hypothetical protein
MGEPFNFKKQVYLNNYNRDLERFQEGTIEQIKTGGDEETFYYNLKLDNNPDDFSTLKSKEVFFDLRRNTDILSAGQYYEVAVEKFSLSSNDIPILIQDKAPNRDKADMTVPNYNYENPYKVYITDIVGGNIQYADVIFNLNTASTLPFYLYDYDLLISTVNRAIQQACNGILGAGINPGDDESLAPYLSYENGKYRFFVPEQYLYEQNDGNPTYITTPTFTIKFSYALQQLLNGFSYFPERVNINGNIDEVLQLYFYKQETTQNTDITIGLADYTVWIFEEQWDSRKSSNEIKKIIFLASSIPIREELIGSQSDTIQRQILDYYISDNVKEGRDLIYAPNIRKWNDLTQDSRLNRISMSVLIEDRIGKQYPLTIEPYKTFDMKLIFRKKKMNV